MSDDAARARILESLDESLLVEAAAGTGKTTALVGRIVSLLQHRRTTIDRVVAVTFTRKAAGELKLRLREELDRRRDVTAAPDERAALEAAMARLEEARIGTIHSFCAELLRERPVEAGIDPAFRELDEDEASALFRRVFDRWVQDALAAGDEALRRALSRLSLERHHDPPLVRLATTAWQLAEWRDHPAPWMRPAFDRAGAIGDLVAQVTALAGMLAQGPQPGEHALRKALLAVEEEARWVARAEAAGPRDLDLLEARLLGLRRQLRRYESKRVGGGRRFGALEKAHVVAARDALLASLDRFEREAGADLAAALRDALLPSLAAYEERKRREGALDFLDLLLRARDLLRDRDEVRAELQRKLTHLFLDEAQDTDPLQAEVLLLLAADDQAERDWRAVRPRAGALFVVGDPKQSVYRFRRADVVLYQQICARLLAAGVARIELSTSYRATRTIQRAVNAAFDAVMTGDRESGQAAYIALEEQRPDPERQPTLIALPLPRPLGRSGEIAKWAVDADQPAAVASFLRWLLEESDFEVEEAGPEGPRRVPVQARHVAILFRRFITWQKDVSQDYVHELEARGLPHVLLGGRSFHDREEVETVRTALRAIEHPDDELAVFATLRGSLLALGDDALLTWKHLVGKFHPFRPVPAELPAGLLPVADALALLARLHRRRNRVPVGETLHDLLQATRAVAGFAVRPAGPQVVRNVQQVAELARAFEARGGLSFRRFVELLDEQAASPETRQSAVVEEGAEGIRIATVHTVKGLEFPVVVLADVGCRLARDEPSRLVDGERRLWAAPLLGCTPWDLHEHRERELLRDRAESERIAYVAATRARDLLVVPVTGVGEVEGWVSALNPALYPAEDRRFVAELAPGCPTRGGVSVLGLPDGYSGEPPPSVRPGLHRARTGTHSVVWFDPAVLADQPAQNFGLRQEHLLAEPADGSLVTADLERHEAWLREREAARERGGAPTLRIEIVTALASDPPLAITIDEEWVERAAGRPAGARFGALVHALLRDVPLGAAREHIATVAAAHGRALGAPAEEVEAAVEAVVRALAHPLLGQRAAAASEVRREHPVARRLDDGSLVEGVIDLLFRDGDGWVVVDFKTDLDGVALTATVVGDMARERYRRQVAWYAWCVEQATGAAARGVLLAV